MPALTPTATRYCSPPTGLKAGGNNRAPLVGVGHALIHQTHSKLYCLCCALTVVHLAHTMHAPCSTVALRFQTVKLLILVNGLLHKTPYMKGVVAAQRKGVRISGSVARFGGLISVAAGNRKVIVCTVAG